MYPELPFCRHRHCSEGAFPHTLASKLAPMKDWKHVWAQTGTKLRISGVTLAVSTAATRAGDTVDIARHSKDSRYAILPRNI